MERRHRVLVYAAVVLVATAFLVGQGLTAPAPGTTPPDPGEAARPYPGETLVTVQAVGWFGNDNGRALVVDQNGSVVWEWAPPNARVFDGEALGGGRFLFSVAQTVRGEDCPERYGDRCVRNRVVEVERGSKQVVWEYSWWDAFPEHHEVHDADRLPNGQTAIADMGNHRAFTVSRDGEVTWSWNASDHLSEGTQFWEQHVPPSQEDRVRRQGPESDWTHMNDIDRLSNGNIQLSIRNFDVVVEVNPATNNIVDVVGSPGKHKVMKEQHNPQRLERHGTLLVADSENDRVVEIDAETGEVVWRYDGPSADDRLRWPRDADRLPNGNTLVTDSRNFRVLEVGPNGSVVWQYSMASQRGIVYEADRLGVPEEPQNVPSGRNLHGRSFGDGALADAVATAESWMGFVFPYWVGIPELLTGLVGLAALVALAVEEWLARRRTRADRS